MSSKKNNNKVDLSIKSFKGFAFKSTNEIAEDFKQSLIDKTTNSEKYFASYLISVGVDFKFQQIISIRDYKTKKEKFFYIVDFYIPKYNLIVEIDGLYHFTKTQLEKDIVRENMLRSRGFNILRLTNEETYSNTTIKNIWNNKYRYKKAFKFNN